MAKKLSETVVKGAVGGALDALADRLNKEKQPKGSEVAHHVLATTAAEVYARGNYQGDPAQFDQEHKKAAGLQISLAIKDPRKSQEYARELVPRLKRLTIEVEEERCCGDLFFRRKKTLKFRRDISPEVKEAVEAVDNADSCTIL